jgi:hypothetical protein
VDGAGAASVTLFRFFEWLGNTSWSIALHESRYVFLLVLMIHVLTLSVFVGTAVMIDLRLLGKTMTRVPVVAGRGAASAVERGRAFS